MDRLARLPVPDQRCLALIGDAKAGNLEALGFTIFDRLARGGDYRCPDHFRVMLHPAGPGVDLREFLLRQRNYIAFQVKHHGAAGGCALIEREDGGRFTRTVEHGCPLMPRRWRRHENAG